MSVGRAKSSVAVFGIAFMVAVGAVLAVGTHEATAQASVTIIVQKQDLTDSGTAFDATITVDDVEVASGTISDDGTTTTVIQGSVESTATVVVNEPQTTGFRADPSASDCVDEFGNSVVTTTGFGGIGLTFTLALALPEGSVVTCTIVNDVAPGRISIEKVTPNGPDLTPFEFTTTGGLPPTFTLDTDPATSSVSEEQTFFVPPGEYTITETPVAGYTSVLRCSDSTMNSTFSGLTATLTVDAEDFINCTFTNIAATATLIVQKDDLGDTGTSFDVRVNSGSGLIADGVISDDGVAPVTFETAIPAGVGTFVSEPAIAGFTPSLLSDCTTSAGTSVLASKDLLSGRGLTLFLRLDGALVVEDDVITCTVINVPDTGQITITKITPAGADATPFGFTTTGGLNPAAFTLDTDDSTASTATQTFTANPGTYTISETALPGYTTSLICSDSTMNSSFASPTATLTVDAGDIIECTFTNTAEQAATGSIVVVADTAPDDPQDFMFTITGPGGAPLPATFSLDDDGDPTLSNTVASTALPAGSYVVTQTTVDGFATTVACSGTGAAAALAAAIDLDPGETVTCTFTNTAAPVDTGNQTQVPAAIITVATPSPETIEPVAPTGPAQPAVAPALPAVPPAPVAQSVGGLAVTGGDADRLTSFSLAILGLGASVGALGHQIRRRTEQR